MLVFLLFILVLPGKVKAEQYASPLGFSVYLPEAYEFTGGDGTTRFSFDFDNGSATMDIILYPAKRFTNAQSAAQDTVKKLEGRAAYQNFGFSGYDACLAELEFVNNGQKNKGWLLFINDVNPAGPKTAPDQDSYDMMLLSYSPFYQNAFIMDIVASAMDSLSLGMASHYGPGPIALAARDRLGKKQYSRARINFGSAWLEAKWDKREASLSQSLVEREYRILTAYAAAPDYLKAAITRFYRMILRDAAPALDELAMLLSSAWEQESHRQNLTETYGGQTQKAAAYNIFDSQERNSPLFGIPASPRLYAEALLAWVQGFAYERDPSGSDVLNPITAAFEGRGDCDSRALVMAILLQRENIDSILMYSMKHEHAMLAVDAPGPGARFPHDKKLWLPAETTAKVGIGLVDSAMADPADWFAVDFLF